jgi:hypothetical protein
MKKKLNKKDLDLCLIFIRPIETIEMTVSFHLDSTREKQQYCKSRKYIIPNQNFFRLDKFSFSKHLLLSPFFLLSSQASEHLVTTICSWFIFEAY